MSGAIRLPVAQAPPCRSPRKRPAIGAGGAATQRSRGRLASTAPRRPPPGATSGATGQPPPRRQHPGAALVLPGFLFSSRQYTDLLAELRGLGYDAEVVPMAFSDWLPVLAGGSFSWYLDRADAALAALAARSGGRVALVGHSAGGWLARLLMGGEPYQGVRYGRQGLVSSLVTLGTPHNSVEQYPFGRAEEALELPPASGGGAPPPAGATTSSLQFCNHFYPSSSSFPDVRLACVCGDAVRGRPLLRRDGAGSNGGGQSNAASLLAYSKDDWGPDAPAASSSGGAGGSMGGGAGGGGEGSDVSALFAWFAYESYKSGCGRGEVDGDGVTPLEIAFVEGAERLVLPGVWHTRDKAGRRPWYGSGAAVAQWSELLRPLPAAAV